jgi:hypothetical protein
VKKNVVMTERSTRIPDIDVNDWYQSIKKWDEIQAQTQNRKAIL